MPLGNLPEHSRCGCVAKQLQVLGTFKHTGSVASNHVTLDLYNVRHRGPQGGELPQQPQLMRPGVWADRIPSHPPPRSTDWPGPVMLTEQLRSSKRPPHGATCLDFVQQVCLR